MKSFKGFDTGVGHNEVVVETDDDRYKLPTCTEFVNHSPSGFQWGYSGSGPAQLAFAILYDVYDEDTAERFYQRFKKDVVSSFDGDWFMTEDEIESYVRSVRNETEA